MFGCLPITNGLEAKIEYVNWVWLITGSHGFDRSQNHPHRGRASQVIFTSLRDTRVCWRAGTLDRVETYNLYHTQSCLFIAFILGEPRLNMLAWSTMGSTNMAVACCPCPRCHGIHQYQGPRFAFFFFFLT